MGTEKTNLLNRLLNPDEKPVCAGPLAGWTDSAYRPILKNCGALHTWIPFVSSHAIVNIKSPSGEKYLHDVTTEKTHVQIFGSNPDINSEAARILEDAGAVSIDFNTGCSVKKIHKGGGGSALLKDLDLLTANLKAIIDSVSIPVSLKTRIGFYSDDKSGMEACRRAADLGCAWVTLHARTAKQGFSGKADWNAIAELVTELPIPVIGNGDILAPVDAKKMFEATGCAGVMIGRGLLGDPWLVSDCEKFLKDGAPRKKRSRSELVDVMLDHQRRLLNDFPDKRGVWEFRKHIARYLRGFAQASVLRNVLVRSNDPSEIARMLTEFGEGRPPDKIVESVVIS